MLNEDELNMQVRKFLKKVGVTSQREIEKAVLDLNAQGKLPEGRPIKAIMTLKIDELALEHRIEDDLEF